MNFPLEKKYSTLPTGKTLRNKMYNVGRNLSNIVLSHHETLSLDHKLTSQNFKVPIGKTPLTQIIQVFLCMELRKLAFKTTLHIQVANTCRSELVQVWGCTQQLASACTAKPILPCKLQELR